MRIRSRYALAVLPATLASAQALAQTSADRLDSWHYGWGWGHMMFGSLMMILFWGGLILLVVLAVRWFGGSAPRADGLRAPDKQPLKILEERFARGEIEKDEFEERKRLLSD